jgi:putative transposase
VRYEAVVAQSKGHRTERLCRVLGVSRSGLYARQRVGESPRLREDRRLSVEVRAVHEESKRRYGSPRVHRELRKRGVRMSRKRVARLMREQELRARARRRFRITTQSRHDHPVVPNRLRRRFTVRRLNRVWLGDITYIWTREGWLYLAVLMDLCSRRVVGWATSARLTEELVHRALSAGLATRRPGRRMLHHTDRGSQYASAGYRRSLSTQGIRMSMSRKGDCWDNAPMESFFSTLKEELPVDGQFETRAQAHAEIFEYIEVFYNRERLHSALGYVSPQTFEEGMEATR